MSASVGADAPFHDAALAIRFPEDAVSVKGDWIHQSVMLEQGLITGSGPDGSTLDPPQNPAHPYVTMHMEGKDIEESGLYYLMALTNISKALPQWHWYAIEHVANPGRCDLIGCNDSFGFQATGTEADGRRFGRNYVPPHPLDGDPDGHAPTGYGRPYLPDETGETMTPALEALFRDLGVAVAETDADPLTLDPADPAWKSYRLKGTQSNFTGTDGVVTLMGASITEGGFVNSSSCMTCHSTASTDEWGHPGIPGIGSVTRLNLFGFQQSASGAPEQTWFYGLGGTRRTALQTDFIWGTLGAKCIEDATDPDAAAKGHCESYENVVLDWPGGADAGN